jgi:hypothetical protein
MEWPTPTVRGGFRPASQPSSSGTPLIQPAQLSSSYAALIQVVRPSTCAALIQAAPPSSSGTAISRLSRQEIARVFVDSPVSNAAESISGFGPVSAGAAFRIFTRAIRLRSMDSTINVRPSCVSDSPATGM